MSVTFSPATSEAEKILQSEVGLQKTPMVQYRYFNPDEILYTNNKGYADLSNRMKADDNTIFNAYSLTKTFTAVAILQLAQRGLLDLDQPVNLYLPHAEVWPTVTIRHLLSHTAGIGNPMPLKWIHLVEEHISFDREKFNAQVLLKKVLQKAMPGKKMAYSNLGYILAGLVIEAVSGLSYEQYITENIIHQQPGENRQLGFTIPHPLLHATGYHNRYSLSGMFLGLLLDKKKYTGQPVGKWLPFKPNYVNGVAYGGLIGTANAFVAFGQALLKENEQLLSSRYKEIMFKEQMLSSGLPTGMSLSWFTGTCNGKEYRMHPGGGGGYYCELRLYPSLKTGSFVVFNRSGFSNERFLDRIDPHLPL